LTGRALDSWREEKRSAYLYRLVSDAESGTPRQVLFLELARAAEDQAALWQEEIRKLGGMPPKSYTPDLRARLVGGLISRLGVAPLKGVLAAMKVRGMALYNAPVSHIVPTRIEQVGERHGKQRGGSLRAAVFGVNDGLVSNASLIMGVAGASGDAAVIVMSGVAGLLAGAFSMAAGEYVSVRAQREFYEYQIGLERDELDQYPHEEAAELALIYEAKGLERADAKQLADTLIRDPDKALDTLSREELGLDPQELGSAPVAAMSSFLAFAIGAFVPLVPYLLLHGALALYGTMAATSVCLFGVGATLSLFTGRKAWLGGVRMLLIGAAAGAATWSIGRLMGVTLG
jgi:VIT1/CCC1 family predicted Fe2+/Mn2+ transporter